MSATATVDVAGAGAAALGVTSPVDSFFSFEQAANEATAIAATARARAERA
jgi:hypothetical protein